MSEKAKFRIEDIIDLEYFFEEDKGKDDGSLVARDAEIFEGINTVGRAEFTLEPKERIFRWLNSRRENRGEAGVLPGTQFRMARNTLVSGATVFAFLLGMGVAGIHLLYGDRPINVTVFFSATVLWQIAILVLMGTFFVFHKTVQFEGVNLVSALVGRLLLLTGEAKALGFKRLDGSSRASLSALWGEIRKRKTIYGEILKWPLFTIVQICAISFNLGILFSTLWLLATSNRAFGWESTFAVGPEVMLRIVEVISIPWSWLPNAHPTIQQITQSQIALQGASNFSADALRSWWPFLCYSIIFWGLVPRIILLTGARIGERRALDRLKFNHADCNGLLRRMAPLVTAGEAPPLLVQTQAAVFPDPSTEESRTCIAIVSNELVVSPERIGDVIGKLGWTPGEQCIAEIDCIESAGELFANIETTAAWNVALLLEAERPPVKAILSFIRRLRKSTVADSEIAVCVLSRGDSAFDYSQGWEMAIAALGDPYLKFVAVK